VTQSRVKELVQHPSYATHHRGWYAPGVEKVVQHLYDKDEVASGRANTPDCKESFECGREDDPDMSNIRFPEGILPGFNDPCLEFYWKIELCILRALRRR